MVRVVDVEVIHLVLPEDVKLALADVYRASSDNFLWQIVSHTEHTLTEEVVPCCRSARLSLEFEWPAVSAIELHIIKRITKEIVYVKEIK